ncbi:GNAT family N-acetyltransferase [Bacillaceae bacterium SIJ1]|uniref:GNAT family N-acetyltransferase n=1 Tax=Litoribacterium kuwaitense TaxID=1398745 RepID=UPI0013EB39A3|nr:GNAT family N-acetyltransferase [Litoribacterium kuwaitense]NGP44372.1 GNAT family N-acetyltransferase [Litoribacterium kuwaitense]
MKQGIHQLTKEDVKAAIELSQYAFQRVLSTEEYNKRMETPPEEFFGYFSDGQLASKLRIRPMHVYMKDTLVKMGGVSNVATWPEYRRQRHVAKLFAKAFEAMRDHGQLVSFLAPFSFAFYRRLGYETLMTRKRYTFTNEDLQFRPFETSLRLERMSKQNQHRLAPVYEQFAKKFQNMLFRTDDWWSEILESEAAKHGYLAIDESGQCQGYMLFSMMDRQLHVRDFIFLTEEAKKTLWNVFKQHDSMADQLTVVMPEVDQSSLLYRQQAFKQTLEPYFMGRIVDVLPFLRMYPFQQVEKPLTIAVKDHWAPWNEATYTLQPGGDVDMTDDEADIVCDIQSLSAIFLSGVSPVALGESEWLQASPATLTRLESILTLAPSYLIDGY